MRVIAISGWRGSGKDIVADYLKNDLGFGKHSFAGSLKNNVADQYNTTRDSCDNRNEKEAPLLNYPVDPQDKFSLAIAKLMFNEFVYADGTKSKDNGFFGSLHHGDKQLYWTPRALCIFEGSGKRSVDSSYWVSKVINNINEVRNKFNSCFVISDLRFQSEIKQLQDAFGDNLTTVRINRFDTIDTNDPSERDLDDTHFDLVLDNKGTLEQFQESISSISWEIGDNHDRRT